MLGTVDGAWVGEGVAVGPGVDVRDVDVTVGVRDGLDVGACVASDIRPPSDESPSFPFGKWSTIIGLNHLAGVARRNRTGR